MDEVDEADPVHEVTVVPGALDKEEISVEFAMGGDQGDFGVLDLVDRVEWCRYISNTKGHGELTQNSLGMNSEGGVVGHIQDRTFIGEEGRGALEVSEDVDELDKVTLVGISVMGSCHDDEE